MLFIQYHILPVPLIIGSNETCLKKGVNHCKYCNNGAGGDDDAADDDGGGDSKDDGDDGVDGRWGTSQWETLQLAQS